MTTINANMTSGQARVPMEPADAASTVAGFYTIDSENIEVLGPSAANTVVGGNRAFSPNGVIARRGVGGSTAASHTSGATITRYYPEAPSGEGGGAPQTVSLVGPFTVDFDMAGLVDPLDGLGPSILTVAAGSMVQAFSVWPSTPFDVTGELDISLGEPDEVAATLYSTDPSQTLGGPIASVAGQGLPLAPVVAPTRALALAETHVRVAYFPDSTSPSEGSVDVYVLIATPS